MRSLSKTRKILTVFFVAVEFVLYVLFLLMDFTSQGDTTWLKYGAIIACLLYSCVLWQRGSLDGYVVTAAMVFTLVADLFLLVLDKWYTVGVASFIVVQLLYFARIYALTGKKPLVSAMARGATVAAAYIVLAMLDSLQIELLLAVFYFVNLAANTVEAFIARSNKKLFVFGIGLSLFMLCDISVALFNAGGFVTISPAIVAVVANLMWLFYLPSQVLIVLSTGFGDEAMQSRGNKI